jgi:hypothetical protein
MRADWAPLLGLVAAITIMVGNWAAVTQENSKRLLAYSSISNAGYLLLALIANNEYGRIGLIVYLFVYTLMNMGAFGVIISLRRRGIIGDNVDDLTGLAHKAPLMAAMMAIFMLSLGGLPVTGGFIGKYFLFGGLIQQGATEQKTWYYWLAGWAIINTVVSVRLLLPLHQGDVSGDRIADNKPLALSPALQVALAVSVIGIIILGVYPQPFIALAKASDAIVVMVIYYFLAVVSCWFGLQSLLSGIRYAAYVRRETSRPLPDFQPFVSVIAPGRGLEPGLIDNLRPLVTQDYPRYEVLFVFDALDDPAIKIVDELKRAVPRERHRWTGDRQRAEGSQPARRCERGRSAIRSAGLCRYGRASAQGLARKLVAPLADETLGARLVIAGSFPSVAVSPRVFAVFGTRLSHRPSAATPQKTSAGVARPQSVAHFHKLERQRALARHRLRRLHDHARSKEAKLPIHFTPTVSLLPSATATFASCSSSPRARSRSRASTPHTSGCHSCSAPRSSPSPSSAALSC